jgi:outer membrane protein assembly factor BamA
MNGLYLKHLALLIAFLVFLFFNIYADNSNEEPEVKTGWNAGFLPVVSYNSDLGFQYGVLTNIYHYGDGSTFPKYQHSIYGEVSRYTKGSGIFRLFYDSEFLIPGVRLTTDFSYLPDQALDFYGFNGYDAVFNKEWTDNNHSDYKTRMYYKHQRNIFRIKIDLQGKSFVNNLNWVLGYKFIDAKIASVPIDKLNEGQDPENMLPSVNGLYENYIDWGIISDKEKEGGIHNNIKFGLVYDTRDNEPCPMKGIWSEAVILSSFSKDFVFGKLGLTHRQYFTLIPRNLSFAYRISYQSVLYGDAPFYMYPYVIYSYMPSSTLDGLGGSKTVRGMMRNRTVGKSMAFANLELRYKFTRFRFIGQNWYAALSPFIDAGIVTQKIEISTQNVPDNVDLTHFFNADSEKPHITYGMGLHVAMNENFVIAIDVGKPVNKQDGSLGIYIGMNWLF